MAAKARKPLAFQSPTEPSGFSVFKTSGTSRAEIMILISASPSILPSIQNTTGRDEVQ